MNKLSYFIQLNFSSWKQTLKVLEIYEGSYSESLIPSYLSWKLIHKMWTTCEQLWKEKWIHVNKARYYRAVFYVDKWMKLFNYSHKMVRDMSLWGFWSHHHLLLLPGHSSLFSRFRVQGSGCSSGFAANHIWGDARRWYSSHQPLVTSHQSVEAPNAIKLRKSLAT